MLFPVILNLKVKIFAATPTGMAVSLNQLYAKVNGKCAFHKGKVKRKLQREQIL
jgi:hypothetical protein